MLEHHRIIDRHAGLFLVVRRQVRQSQMWRDMTKTAGVWVLSFNEEQIGLLREGLKGGCRMDEISTCCAAKL